MLNGAARSYCQGIQQEIQVHNRYLVTNKHIINPNESRVVYAVTSSTAPMAVEREPVFSLSSLLLKLVTFFVVVSDDSSL